MVDLEKTIGTAAGIIGTGVLAGFGIASISIPIAVMKGVVDSVKKETKPKEKEDEKEPADMMSKWEKTWMG